MQIGEEREHKKMLQRKMKEKGPSGKIRTTCIYMQEYMKTGSGRIETARDFSAIIDPLA